MALITIFQPLIPLYTLISLGFIAQKTLNSQRESFSSLLIYIIGPILIFYGTLTAPLEWQMLSLPILFFSVSNLLAFLFYWIGSKVWPKQNEKNIIPFIAGTGNTGYFGLPVILTLLGENTLSIVVLSVLGFVLFENTTGFFLAAKGNHSLKESCLKIIKLPTLYAFILGLIANRFGVQSNSIPFINIEIMKGTYTFFGMIIIGMAIANLKWTHFDWKFLSLSFIAKFLAWPLVIFTLISIDQNLLHFYSEETHKVMWLLSLVPLAANTVAISTELKVQPEKTALAVFTSTCFALIFIPLTANWI